MIVTNRRTIYIDDISFILQQRVKIQSTIEADFSVGTTTTCHWNDNITGTRPSFVSLFVEYRYDF
jgi:hypothetical protein